MLLSAGSRTSLLVVLVAVSSVTPLAIAAGPFDGIGNSVGKSLGDALGSAINGAISPQQQAAPVQGQPSQAQMSGQKTPAPAPVQPQKSAGGTAKTADGMVLSRPYSTASRRGAACITVAQHQGANDIEVAINNCGVDVFLIWHSPLQGASEMCHVDRVAAGKRNVTGNNSTYLAACRNAPGIAAPGSVDCECPAGTAL